MLDDADEVSADTLKNDLVCNGFEQADGRDGFQYRDHGIDGGASHGLIGEKANESGRDVRACEGLQVPVTLLEEPLHRGCILGSVDFLLLLSWLLVLDVLNALAGDVGEAVGDFLSNVLPLSTKLACRVSVDVYFKQDEVAKGIEHVRDLSNLLEFIRRLLFLEGDVQNFDKGAQRINQFKL